MGIYRRLARSKKGMSTIFGGLFFVILILMGFNLMLWSFIQYDSYNNVISSMNERDQQAGAENLVPTNPGAVDFNVPAQSFNITVNNLGIAVSIARIYIVNLSPTGSNQCTSSPCIIDTPPASPNFGLGNVREGEINHKIKVTGILINDGSGYKVILASTRGRLFSFFYPWPQAPAGGSGSGVFLTNIGPLGIFFDFKSFNFTQGSQTQSQPAWILPVTVNMVFWIKIQNFATDSSVTITKYSSLVFEPYTDKVGGARAGFHISDKDTLNPNNVIAYDETVDPYVLPAAGPGGPSASVIVKFGSRNVGTSEPENLGNKAIPYVVMIGFYYSYQGNFQGQTVPFVATRTCATFPTC